MSSYYFFKKKIEAVCRFFVFNFGKNVGVCDAVNVFVVLHFFFLNFVVIFGDAAVKCMNYIFLAV